MGMKAEHINPFIAAAQHVLKTTCNEELTIGKLSVKKVPLLTADVVIILGITGHVEGQVIFSLDESVARGIASKMMMNMPVATLDEMAKSAICELTNMILGNAATTFYNEGIQADITPPSLFIGRDMTISTIKGDFVTIPLQFMDSGMTFEVNVCMTEKEGR